MRQYWDNQDVPGRGTRLCLVMDPEDGTHPIRTYGKDKDEILEKVARTAATAQQVITRQRANPPANGNGSAPQPPAQPARPKVTADEQMQATADLSNPAKAPGAIKTLLRAGGVDMDRERVKQEAERVAAIAQEWERQHPEFSASDERNKRLLLNTASAKVGFTNIDAAALDTAYEELRRFNMFFEEAPIFETPNPSDASNGNSATVDRPRTATSYRATSLRSGTPAVHPKPKYTSAEVDRMNSKQLREKIETDPEFTAWYNREYSRAATA
jgi:hypothetical protein